MNEKIRFQQPAVKKQLCQHFISMQGQMRHLGLRFPQYTLTPAFSVCFKNLTFKVLKSCLLKTCPLLLQHVCLRYFIVKEHVYQRPNSSETCRVRSCHSRTFPCKTTGLTPAKIEGVRPCTEGHSPQRNLEVRGTESLQKHQKHF